MSTPLLGHCRPCHGTGWLLGQTYGGWIPEGFEPIQRCDECMRWESDEDAARAYADLHGQPGWIAVQTAPEPEDAYRPFGWPPIEYAVKRSEEES